MYRFGLVLLLLCVLSPLPATAQNLAVVDVQRILIESQPGKAGEEHMIKVRGVLLGGLNDLQAMYKGKENTPTARKELHEGQLALERQLMVERQAVLNVIGELLSKAIKTWRAANPKYLAVINSQNLLDSDASINVTDAVMAEVNKLQPVFSPLPTVTIKPPAAEPAPNKIQKKR